MQTNENGFGCRQKGCCYWFTGLPAAGKTTIAREVSQNLLSLGYRVSVLDGDELRHGLNRDLGFSRVDRAENIRRIAEVARFLVDAEVIVLVAAISPYQDDRQAAKTRIGDQRCFEVFVDTGLETCIGRDPKGLYARAKVGGVKELTGWDAPYERPVAPEVTLCTDQLTVAEAAQQIETHYRRLIDEH